MKEYECIQVKNHKKVAEKIQEYLMNGWHLHTYQATGQAALTTHYLLFERGQPVASGNKHFIGYLCIRRLLTMALNSVSKSWRL